VNVGSSPAQSSQHQVPSDSRHDLEDGKPTLVDDLRDSMSPRVADRPVGSLVDQADNLSAHETLYDTHFSRLRSAISIDPDTSTDEQPPPFVFDRVTWVVVVSWPRICS
jgi:hypothetical protein